MRLIPTVTSNPMGTHPYMDERDGDLAASTAPHVLGVRVYYEDTDFSGVVYHASYLRFLERGRTEFLRTIGVEHQKIFSGGDTGGFYFVVRAMAIEFIRPALMDDSLRVETRILSVGGASIEMAQHVLRRTEPLVTAKVKIAVVAGGKPRRLPADVAALLRAAVRTDEQPDQRLVNHADGTNESSGPASASRGKP